MNKINRMALLVALVVFVFPIFVSAFMSGDKYYTESLMGLDCSDVDDHILLFTNQTFVTSYPSCQSLYPFTFFTFGENYWTVVELDKNVPQDFCNLLSFNNCLATGFVINYTSFYNHPGSPPTPTIEPSPSPEFTPTPSPSIEPTPTATPSPSPTPTPTPSPSIEPTPTATPSPSPTPTIEPTPTATPSP